MKKYITCVYGRRYAGMLMALLESVYQCDPMASLVVYHQDDDAELVEALQRAYGRATFVETDFDFSSSDRAARISSKVVMWAHAIASQPPGETVCLVDVDVLVVQPPFRVLEEAGVDVVFTDKDEQFRLNSGVMLVRTGAPANAFFEAWRGATNAIINDKRRAAIASSPVHPFGGADQMSLYELISYSPEKKRYSVSLGGVLVELAAVSCGLINETNSKPITPSTHIIHYKGGWQPILLEGRCFWGARSWQKSAPMYEFFLGKFLSSVARVQRTAGFEVRDRTGIVVHSWWARRISVVGRMHFAAWRIWSSTRDGSLRFVVRFPLTRAIGRCLRSAGRLVGRSSSRP